VLSSLTVSDRLAFVLVESGMIEFGLVVVICCYRLLFESQVIDIGFEFKKTYVRCTLQLCWNRKQSCFQERNRRGVTKKLK